MCFAGCFAGRTSNWWLASSLISPSFSLSLFYHYIWDGDIERLNCHPHLHRLIPNKLLQQQSHNKIHRENVTTYSSTMLLQAWMIHPLCCFKLRSKPLPLFIVYQAYYKAMLPLEMEVLWSKEAQLLLSSLLLSSSPLRAFSGPGTSDPRNSSSALTYGEYSLGIMGECAR